MIRWYVEVNGRRVYVKDAKAAARAVRQCRAKGFKARARWKSTGEPIVEVKK